MVDPTAASAAELRTTRGIQNYLKAMPPETRIPAEIRGIVVHRWSRAKLQGCWLQDITGKINLLLDESCVSFHVGSRLVARGLARISTQRKQLVLESVDVLVVSSDALLKSPPQQGDVAVPTHVTGSFILAQLRQVASSYARSLGYREFEPRYLSTPLLELHAEPLAVSFRGWGSSIHLATSPAPQLLQVLLETGENKVFAIGRCFSSAYRDGFSSAEKLALVTRELGERIEVSQLAAFAESLIRKVLMTWDTAMLDQRVSGEWEKDEKDCLGPVSVEKPEIHLQDYRNYQVPTRIFRIVLPPGITVAEGGVEIWAPTLAIGGAVVHLERFMYLLYPHRLSQIPHLGPPKTLNA
jgi:hypothetical protein